MREIPSDHFGQGKYDTHDYWEERAKRYRPEDPYASVCGYKADRLYNQLMEALQLEVFRKLTHDIELESKHIMEIGCGIGRWAKLFVEFGADYKGLDISETMIEIATEHVPEGHFQVGSATNLPFPNESFDFVFTCTVLHHLPPEDQAAATQEIARVVKDGGHVAIIEGIRQPIGWFNMFAKKPSDWRELFQNNHMKVKAEYKHRHDKNFRLFNKLALSVSNIEYFNILIPSIFYMAGMSEKLLRGFQDYRHFAGVGLQFKRESRAAETDINE